MKPELITVNPVADLRGCEHCGKEFPIERMTMMADCWICEACYADFKAHFDICEHEWAPSHDEHGDPSQYCHKCSGIVRDEDMASLGLAITLPDRPDAS